MKWKEIYRETLVDKALFNTVVNGSNNTHFLVSGRDLTCQQEVFFGSDQNFAHPLL